MLFTPLGSQYCSNKDTYIPFAEDWFVCRAGSKDVY